MELKNHAAVVTGGASGLGEATARALAEGGARVALLDADKDRGAQVARDLGESALFLPLDVSDQEAVDQAVKDVQDAFGGFQIVVNCAGIGGSARIVGKDGAVSPEWFTRIVNVNLVGTFYVIRATAPVLMANQPNEAEERGVCINTASIAATDGQVGQAAYSASKGGIVSMTLTLAREFSGAGIRFMSVLPGVFRTPLLERNPEKVLDRLSRQVPFPPRLGKAGEFASLVCEIIRNPYLNGEAIRLDGGLRMGFSR